MPVDPIPINHMANPDQHRQSTPNKDFMRLMMETLHQSMLQAQSERTAAAAHIARLEEATILLSVKTEEAPRTATPSHGLDSGTPEGRAHAQKKRCAAAARHFRKACRGCTPFPAGCTPSIGVQPCQTGVQSLHACLEGVQSLHALRTGVQALHACWLTSNCAAHKPATKLNHPDPQANDRPRLTDTHQTQPS
ncbi:hypothetical protein PCANC_22660, partial [Puccinia coronata f. sp. avenae]